MPEGDTIHRVAARLRPAIEGEPLVGIELARHAGPLPSTGERIESVRARGKHLLIRFSGGATLRVHLRMTGSWYLFEPGARWSRSRRSAVVVLEVPDWVAVCFSAPDVELVWGGGDHTEHLGPDLCDDSPDFALVLQRARSEDAATSIGELVMDQRVACGIGNVYKSEALWAEHVAPTMPIGALDDERLVAVFERAHRQLRENLGRPGGRTTVPGGYAAYGRAGEPCPRCGVAIARIVQGRSLPRSTYFCPQCQLPGE